jgi:hypothetical protein
LPGGLIVQNHIEQRLVDPDAAVVFDKAVLAKAIHEEADAGAGGADHLGEGLLGDLGNERFGFAWLAELRHQQQDAGKALLAGVEELVDEIGLGPHSAGEQELEEEVGEAMLLVHDADHLVAPDPERGAGGDGGGGGQAQAGDAGDRLFSNEVAGDEQGDGGLLAAFGDDGEFGATGLQVEDAIGRVSLREEGLFGLQADELSSQSGVGQEGYGIEH